MEGASDGYHRSGLPRGMMTKLSVSNYLARLQKDPFDVESIAGIKAIVESGDQEALGDDPVRLLESARVGHERRAEYFAAAALIDIEARMVGDEPSFQAALYRELGRIRREELLDAEGALEAYQKVLEIDPEDEQAEEALEQMEHAESSYQDIAARFVEEAEAASDPTLKSSFLSRAAATLYMYGGEESREKVDELFRLAVSVEPGQMRPVRLYSVMLRAEERYEELASLLLAAGDAGRNRDEKLQCYLHAGRLRRHFLEDEEGAASCYERVIDFTPGHTEAMEFLVGYFTEREEWDHVVAIYDDALRGRQRLEDEQGILLQIGMVHYRMRGDAESAEPYFARLRKLDPRNGAMLNFYESYYEGGDPEGKLVSILSDAQRVVTDPEEKLALSIRLAEAAQRSGIVERAIDAWKSVQRLDRSNTRAQEALRELFAQGDKWNALVEVLRAEFDSLGDDALERKLEILEELVTLYRDRLGLDAMVVQTSQQILALDPKNERAFRDLASTYESLGRWNELLQLLAKRAEIEEDRDTQIALHLRTATLWIERFANFNQATKPLEAIVELDPNHLEALQQLRQIYAKKRAWAKLAEVLGRMLELGEGDPLDLRRELAQIRGERLHEYGEAIGEWKKIAELSGDEAEAYEQIERLAERAQDWPSLVEALEKKIERSESDQERAALLQKLGQTLGDRLDDAQAAAEAWKRLLAIDPKNGRALRTLRESYLRARDYDALEALYAETEDWEGLVDVLGKGAERVEDVEEKIELSFRAAAVYAERIGEPQRGFRSYERVLNLDPGNLRAAKALVPIYTHDEKWPRLVEMLEILAIADPAQEDAPAPEEKLELAQRIRDLRLEKMSDEKGAFGWAVRAFEVEPSDADVRTSLEKLAGLVGDYERVVELYKARLPGAPHDEALELRRRIAAFANEQLSDTEEAIDQLNAILEAEPQDGEALRKLDALYRDLNRIDDLVSLYEHRLEHIEDEAARVETLLGLARLEEELRGNHERAAKFYRELIEIEPAHAEALEGLDRLTGALGLHQEQASILERRLDRLDLDDAARAELETRLGSLQAFELNQAEEGVERLGRALEFDRQSAMAIAALERIDREIPAQAIEAGRYLEAAYTRKGNYARLAEILKKRLDALDDELEKQELRLRLAELAASELNDPKGAYRALEAAFLERPDDAELWDRLGGAAEAANAHRELAEALSTALEASDDLDPSVISELSGRAAEIYDTILGESEKAEPFHKKRLALDPLDDTSFESLKELYTTRERWDDLQALYRNRIAETSDPDGKLELLRQVCFLFEEILEEPDMAIESYQAVLELAPDHAPSQVALERLYRQRERWSDLVAILLENLETAEGQEAIELHLEVGELYEKRLNEPHHAVDHFELVLERSPRHLAAQEALERILDTKSERQRIATILEPLYESQGAWPELTRILEVQLDEAADPAHRLSLYVRLAEIAERNLNDLERAFSALASAVEVDPDDLPARESLLRVARRKGDLEGAAASLLRAAENSNTPYVEAEILLVVGALLQDEIGDDERAKKVFVRLLDIDPDNPETVMTVSKALERIHLASEDYPALIEDLRRQARYEDDYEARNALLIRVADLYELQLGDLEGAIATHRERLEHDPADRGALRALERLHEQNGEWLELIGVLQNHETVADEEDEQLEICRRIGEIYETKLNDAENAIVAYNEVLSRFSTDESTLIALTRLYEKGEKWEDLREILETRSELTEEPSERAELRYQIAEIQRKHTRDIESAIEILEDILSERPEHQGALESLSSIAFGDDLEHRVSAARALRPVFEARGDHEGLIRALEVLGESDDAYERVESLRRASEIADLADDGAKRAFELMGRALLVGASSDDAGDLVAELRRVAERADEPEAHVEILKQAAPDIMDGELVVEVLMEIATIALDRLGDKATARTYYERALENQPEHRGALHALDRLFVDMEEHEALADILRRKAEIAESDAEQAEVLLRFASIAEEKLEDISGAIDSLERVIDLGARDVSTFESLARLYRRARRYDDLIQLLERQIDEGIGEIASARLALARLLLDKRDDPFTAFDLLKENTVSGAEHDETVSYLEELMAGDRFRGDAARLLEPVYLSRSDWAKVSAALDACLSIEDDLEARKEIFERMGQLHEDYLEDLDGALEAYARLFNEDPYDQETWETLTRLARVQDRWERLADIFAEALEKIDVDGPETAELSSLAGHYYLDRVNAPAKAAPLLKRALDFDPSNRDVFESLERTLKELEDWAELVELYRAGADNAETEDERVEILRRAAIIEEVKRADVEAALAFYRSALESDPSYRPALDAVEKLLRQTKRYEELADHLRFRAEGELEDAARNETRHRLARLLHEELDSTDEAIDLLEEIVGDDPAHSGAIATLEEWIVIESAQVRISEILEPLYRDSGQWMKQIAILEARAQHSDDPVDRRDILLEIARLHEENGGDLNHAFEAYLRAFEADPMEDEARYEADRLADELGCYEELVAGYQRAAEGVSDDPVRAGELLEQVARYQDERLGDSRAAIATYERLAELLPDDPAPHDALEELHTMVGDWLGMVAVIEKKVERSVDPIERAELLRRAASVVEELVVDPERAIELYRRAADEDESDRNALEALDRLYLAKADYAALAEVVERLIGLEDKDSERIALGLRLASLHEVQLDDADRAIAALENVILIDPAHGEALSGLARLFERKGDHRNLLDILRTQADLAEGAPKVALILRAGEVLERDLDDVEEAITTYEEVFSHDPESSEALEALMRIARLEQYRERAAEILEPRLRELSRFDELAEILELSAAGSVDPFGKKEKLRALAEVHDACRGDLPAAFDAYARAFAEEPEDETIFHELDRLGDETGKFAELADLFENSAQTVGDPDMRARLFKRVSEIAEGALEDLERAARTMARAAEANPDDELILEQLDRLYTLREQYDELAPVLEKRLEAALEPEAQLDFLARIGAIRKERFADLNGAFDAYSRMLEIEPSRMDAREALFEIAEDPGLVHDCIEVLDRAYRESGDLRAAAELYTRRVELAMNPGEKVALYLEAAALWEEELREPTRALTARLRAFELEPTDISMIDEIERLALLAGATEKLRGLVERAQEAGLDPMNRHDLNLRAAGWYRDQLGDREAAESRLRSAIEGDPESEEANSQLVALLREEGDPEKLVAALSAWAERGPGDDLLRELRLEAARISESLGKVDEAIVHLEALLENDPSEREALAELSRLREAREEWTELAELYERRIEVEDDPDTRLSLRRRFGALYGGRLEDSERAIEAFMGILDEEPGDLAAISALEELYEKAERWDDLRELIDRRLDLAETDADRIAARVRMARLEETAFGRRAEAIDVLQETLDLDASNAEALSELERLYVLEERYDEAVELAERRFAAEDDPETKRTILLQLADLHLEKRGDRDGAIGYYERVLELAPEDLATLDALFRIHSEAGDEIQAAAILERSLALREPSDALQRARELAEMAREKLADVTLEERALRFALDLDPSDVESRAALKAFHERKGNFEALGDLLELEFEEAADDAAKIAHLRSLAELYQHRLSDPARAAEYLEKASALAPDDREILLPLCDLYVDAGRQTDAIPVLEKIIESFGGRRTKELAAFHHRLGRAYQSMGEIAKALEEYESAFRIDLTNIAVLRDLGKLSYEQGDLERAQKTFRALLLQRLDDQSGITKGDIYFYLGDIAAKQGDARRAISMLERALSEEKDHSQAADLLSSLKG